MRATSVTEAARDPKSAKIEADVESIIENCPRPLGQLDWVGAFVREQLRQPLEAPEAPREVQPLVLVDESSGTSFWSAASQSRYSVLDSAFERSAAPGQVFKKGPGMKTGPKPVSGRRVGSSAENERSVATGVGGVQKVEFSGEVSRAASGNAENAENAGNGQERAVSSISPENEAGFESTGIVAFSGSAQAGPRAKSAARAKASQETALEAEIDRFSALVRDLETQEALRRVLPRVAGGELLTRAELEKDAAGQLAGLGALSLVYDLDGPKFGAPDAKPPTLELGLDGVAEVLRAELLARLENAQTLETLFSGFYCSVGVLVRVLNTLILDGAVRVLDDRGRLVPLLLDTPLSLSRFVAQRVGNRSWK